MCICFWQEKFHACIENVNSLEYMRGNDGKCLAQLPENSSRTVVWLQNLDMLKFIIEFHAKMRGLHDRSEGVKNG